MAGVADGVDQLHVTAGRHRSGVRGRRLDESRVPGQVPRSKYRHKNGELERTRHAGVPAEAAERSSVQLLSPGGSQDTQGTHPADGTRPRQHYQGFGVMCS